MKEFNEARFINYLSNLHKAYQTPSSDYEKGVHDIIKRIYNEFIADHYETIDQDK